MKKFTLTFLSFSVLSITSLFAQTPTRVLDKENMREGEHVEYCTTHKKMAEAMKNPEHAAYILAAKEEARLAAQQKKGESGTTKATVYTVPVVFHILHNNGVENISDEQILDALAILNRDYRKQNADTANVLADFVGMPSDIEIEFALARKDPTGACFSGITRTVTALTFDGSDGQAQVNAVIAGNDVYQGVWPHNKYLNIYVCNEIGGAAGYTFNPFGGSTANATGMYFNGIFVLHNYTGSIGTSSSGTSRTLTHEVGHWLNLSHVWGGNNNPGSGSCATSVISSSQRDNYDDEVDDTPLCLGSTTCNYNQNTCDDTVDPNNWSSWSYNVRDNMENYMDYSYCSKMFTPGQRTRMRNAIESTTAGRSNIKTAANHTATGIFDPLVLCEAKFSTNKQIVCVNESIQFSDDSYNSATGWNWTFAGGTPATSTAQNPSVTYSTPGTYTVTLSATDGSATDVETITNYITVLPGGGEALPYFEGFETITALASSPRWFIYNSGGNAWDVTTAAAHSGTKSAKLTNFGQGTDNIDEMISNTVDLSSITASTGMTLSFRYAYRKRTSTSADYLRVYLTNDCATTWDVRKTLTATNMSGTSTSSTAWTPTASDWLTVHMTNVTSQYWAENFRFKFNFDAGGGNNIYIDDINIYSGTPSDVLVLVGLDEVDAFQQANLFPNPADNEVNVSFNSVNNQDVIVTVTDVTGKQIQKHFIHAIEGQNLVTMTTEELASGAYFVTLNSGASVKTMQFVVK
jgi:PKD repeat protein